MSIPTPPLRSPQEPAKPRRRWLRRVGATAAILASFFLGLVATQDGLPETTAVDDPAPAETVTVEVPAEIPAECLAALDDADELLDLASDFADITADVMVLASDGVMAAGTFDVDGMEASTAGLLAARDDMEAVTAQVEASTYALNRDACRSAVQ